MATAMERRAWVRYGSDLDAVCRASGAMKDAGWTAKVKDISMGGVGLLMRHRFRPGTPLLVELKNKAGTVCRIVPARVVHVKPAGSQAEACWQVGCAFVSNLTEEEVKSLL